MSEIKIVKLENYSTSSSTSELGSGPEKDGYDVDRTNGGTAWYAYYSIVCATAGTGMLGLPSALKRGGWGGVALIITALIMSIYGGVILQKSMYKGKHRRLASYKELATESFGWIGGWVAFFFTFWILVGTPILYLVLAAQSLNQLCEGTAGEIGTFAWTIIWCVVVGIPFIFLKTMNNVAWASLFGAIAISATVLITVILSGIDAPNQLHNPHDNVIWEGFPVALATISYGAGTNIIYANVEGSMKDRRQWPKVIIGALGTCMCLYIAVAVCGYEVYGTNVDNPVYNSTPDGPARTVAIVLVVINVVISSPIYMLPFAVDVENMLNITVERFGNTKELLIRAAFRTSIMVFVAAVGILIPFFDLLMSLFGALANASLVFVLPVLFYWRLTGIRNKHIIELAWNCLILLFGGVAFVFGTWAAIEDLIDAFKDGYEYRI
ncbi:transmembrane amino acid transporter protein-domain-containing protein [Phascolomyces articulosus]|uniref:Transmembrane amino acid transporter protein-domain-containing protein n=1 Tax=Phascolomyces articulosus TaxID=60185 RepID=A0AAD5PJ13_9FUNG|nr:transmembrane amino acid transporter protein-domain-containing protein [Phascolomyces articulosus]